MSWRDVTAECEIDSDHDLVHGDVILTCDEWPIPGYRLTRISGPLTPHVAFIVEKEE